MVQVLKGQFTQNVKYKRNSFRDTSRCSKLCRSYHFPAVASLFESDENVAVCYHFDPASSSSLWQRWNSISLGWWRKWWRAVWGFESRFFRRRLFKGCSRHGFRLGLGGVHSHSSSGGRLRGLQFRWYWSPWFGVQDWQPLVSLVKCFGYRMK